MHPGHRCPSRESRWRRSGKRPSTASWRRRPRFAPGMNRWPGVRSFRRASSTSSAISSPSPCCKRCKIAATSIPETAKAVAEALHDRIQREGSEAVATEADEREKVADEVQRLQAKGALDEKAISEALGEGKHFFVTEALAALGRVPVRISQRILNTGNAVAVAALCLESRAWRTACLPYPNPRRPYSADGSLKRGDGHLSDGRRRDAPASRFLSHRHGRGLGHSLDPDGRTGLGIGKNAKGRTRRSGLGIGRKHPLTKRSRNRIGPGKRRPPTKRSRNRIGPGKRRRKTRRARRPGSNRPRKARRSQTRSLSQRRETRRTQRPGSNRPKKTRRLQSPCPRTKVPTQRKTRRTSRRGSVCRRHAP